MGLFKSKKQQSSPSDEAATQATSIFDEQYREELRSLGREHFQKLIDDNAADFKQQIDSLVPQLASELKAFMTKRLDETTEYINGELTKQLGERLAEHNQAMKEAQDQTVHSLERNAQALHDKYQQLSQALEQSIASQESAMIAVFEESKARLKTNEGAQDEALRSLQKGAKSAETQTEQLNQMLKQAVIRQNGLLNDVYNENKVHIEATKQAQDAALQTLNESAQVLKQQYDELTQTLAKTIANQEAIMVNTFQNNMAQIIEHYVLGAIGEQYDIKSQLPSIIKQLEANKQAMTDDMKL